MKIIAFILVIYLPLHVLVLSHNGCRHTDKEIVAHADHEDGDDHKSCSPFCMCNFGDMGLTFSFIGKIEIVDIFLYAISPVSKEEGKIIQFSTAVWQPPRI